MKNIAVFASGNGSNAENIVRFFNHNNSFNAKVLFIITNKKQAGVINKVKILGVGSFVFTNAEIAEPKQLIVLLKENNIDLIVLAGFLRPIPIELLKLYSNKIINIHPSLLPNYGGKGMYGFNIHEAVLANKEKETGITIHYVIEEYDKGEIIFQTKCSIAEDETVDSLAKKIYQLEQKHFPEIIEKVLAKL